MLEGKLGKRYVPTFTAINERTTPSSDVFTGPDCKKVWESVSQERSSRHSIFPTVPTGDKPLGCLLKRRRSLSIGSSTTASSAEQKQSLERYQRALPPREPSHPGYRLAVNLHDHHSNQERGSSTLELSQNDVRLEQKSDSNEYDWCAANKTSANQHSEKKEVGTNRRSANRTKTGCGTCRRRKKKCDEAKPTCNNCWRGNFECAGYAEAIPWLKNNNAKAPPPLQSQELTPSAKARVHIVGCTVSNVAHTPHCEPINKLCVEAGAFSRIENSQDRLFSDNEQRHMPLAYSGSGKTCAKQQQNAPEHPPLPPLGTNSPPFYYHTSQSMNHTVLNLPAAAIQLTNYVQPPHRAPGDEGSPVSNTRTSCLLPPMALMPAAPPTSTLPYYARLCLPPKTEKDKMLLGERFRPKTQQLVDERELCSRALFCFNSSHSKASVRVGFIESQPLLRDIVAAKRIYALAGERRDTGHLGEGVSVSAPFHCDYGYNISIGDNVVIGPDCQLLDSGRIAVGRNTKIGARVTISTLGVPTDVWLLEGSKGTAVAREVYIGENVYIGDGCTVEAGVRIGNNAIVRAGSVVVRDIPANCVVAGNPAEAQQVDRTG